MLHEAGWFRPALLPPFTEIRTLFDGSSTVSGLQKEFPAGLLLAGEGNSKKPRNRPLDHSRIGRRDGTMRGVWLLRGNNVDREIANLNDVLDYIRVPDEDKPTARMPP